MPTPPREKTTPIIEKIETNANNIFWLAFFAILAFLVAATALLSVWILNSVNPNFSGVSNVANGNTDGSELLLTCTNSTLGSDDRTFKGKTEFGYVCPESTDPCYTNICGTDGQCHQTLVTEACATAEYTPIITNSSQSLDYANAMNVSGLYTQSHEYIDLEILIQANPFASTNETNMSFEFSLPDGVTADTTATNVGYCIATPNEAAIETTPTDTIFGNGYVLLSNTTSATCTLYNDNTDFIGPLDDATLYTITVGFKFKIVV